MRRAVGVGSEGSSYNIADEAWVRELMGAWVAGKLMDLLCKVVFR